MEGIVSLVRRVSMIASLCAAIAVVSLAQTFTTAFSFDGANGAYPYAGLVQGANGELYGTTAFGGAYGFGTVFKITPNGTLTSLYSFCSLANCADGSVPYTGLIQAADGDLYGTTVGGAQNGGTVFKVTPSGTLTTLYSFCSLTNCTDGYYPSGALVQVANGGIYGTTSGGGAQASGTVFKITHSGTVATVYSFCSLANCADGGGAHGLVQVTDGKLYGTTPYTNSVPGDGTVFSLSVGLGPFVEPQRTSGAVGSIIKILGTDLTGAKRVAFNGTAAAFTVVSASLITATVPPGATTGAIQVVTPRGALSSNLPFRVLP